ncbi:MAG: monofunctional biosynthetic peptidoglycan transglycosylase [Pseudomonadota bacterium]
MRRVTSTLAAQPMLWALRFLFGLVMTVHLYALILAFVPVTATANMAIRSVETGTLRQNWTPLEDMSPHLVRAVIAAEDTRFCAHEGIDFGAIEQALEERETSGRVRGASTITQQTAKNVFLWNGGGWVRKAPEAWMALFIDQFWGKRRVMEVYLNVAEWGDGRFGAEAAARYHLNKTAAQLTPYEAALLASVLPSPNKWRVRNAGPYVRSRASTLVARMRTVDSQGLDRCVLG